jgi:hypothetical protein
MIQCIGRILRLHPTKKIANVYMPCSTEENTKDIRSFIKQLTEYDYKFKEAAQEKKIGTYINFEEVSIGGEKENEDENLSGELKEDIQHKYDIIYDSFGVDSRVNLLLEFINVENRPPKKLEIYKDVKLGVFFDNIKHGYNNKLYKQFLETNEMLKEAYEKFQKNKEEKKGKEVVTLVQKCNLLLEFVNENNRQPRSKEKYKEVKIGSFWIGIKYGDNNNLYKKYLEQNDILREEYERFQQMKEEKKGKEITTPEQKCNLLLKFVNENNRQPAQLEIYKDIKVGIFWSNIKKGQINNLYKKILEPNIILKTEYERIQQGKEEKKGKEIITPEQKCNLLLEFINLENRLPVKSEIYKGVKLGQFLDGIKQGQSNNLYKNYLEKNVMVRTAYEKINQMKEEKKGKEITTPEQKCNLLLKFFNENNRLPTQKEKYKEVKIGIFFSKIKTGQNNNLYKQFLETNEMLKEAYEKFQQMKDEKEGKEVITPYQKLNLLLEFVNQNNRPPKKLEIYKEVKIGIFFSKIKTGQNNNLYKQFLETNETLKEAYEKFQQMKEEKKGNS